MMMIIPEQKPVDLLFWCTYCGKQLLEQEDAYVSRVAMHCMACILEVARDNEPLPMKGVWVLGN